MKKERELPPGMNPAAADGRTSPDSVVVRGADDLLDFQQIFDEISFRSVGGGYAALRYIHNAFDPCIVCAGDVERPVSDVKGAVLLQAVFVNQVIDGGGIRLFRKTVQTGDHIIEEVIKVQVLQNFNFAVSIKL